MVRFHGAFTLRGPFAAEEERFMLPPPARD
jgi:hypothetical protein